MGEIVDRMHEALPVTATRPDAIRCVLHTAALLEDPLAQICLNGCDDAHTHEHEITHAETPSHRTT